jgi:alkylhydroperoxidase family enzyme
LSRPLSTNTMARIRIPTEVERRVRAAAWNRCGYCLSSHITANLEDLNEYKLIV